jgi:hypothetical protein
MNQVEVPGPINSSVVGLRQGKIPLVDALQDKSPDTAGYNG